LNLVNTAGKLFPDQQSNSEQANVGPKPTNLKPPPVASFSIDDSSQTLTESRVNAEIVDDDAKPQARQNLYNSAARIHSNSNNCFYASLIKEQEKEALANSYKQGDQIKVLLQPDILENNRTLTQTGRNSHDMDTDADINLVERLNRSIAQKQAQLQQLQHSLVALKPSTSPPPAESPQKMEEDDTFTTILPGYKKRHKELNASPKQPNTKIQALVNRAPRDPLTELAIKRPSYPVLPEPVPRRRFTIACLGGLISLRQRHQPLRSLKEYRKFGR
jgi:hypothetical protein